MIFNLDQIRYKINDLLNEIFQIAEEYDSTKTYAVDDYCTYEGKILRCTSATSGAFDSSAWTDAVIVMNAIKAIKARLTTAESSISAAQSDISDAQDDISALNTVLTQSQTWITGMTLSPSLYNCTGTITGSISMFYTTDRKLAVLWGRIRITNFSRTGGNPGVTLSLPFTHDRSFPIGYRGESPVEQVNLSFASGRLTTTESYSNVTGSVLTLMVPAAIVPMI